MHHSVSVAVGSSLQDLVGETLHILWRKWTTNVPHVFLQIELAILKNEVELVFRVDNFLQPKLD